VLLKGFAVFRFTSLYALPILIFAFCYWRILAVIRRKGVIKPRVGPSNFVQVAEASTCNVDDKTNASLETGNTSSSLKTEEKCVQTFETCTK